MTDRPTGDSVVPNASALPRPKCVPREVRVGTETGKPVALYWSDTGDVLAYLPNGKTRIEQGEECGECSERDIQSAKWIATTLNAAPDVGAAAQLELCPDGCYRQKARNADDCAAGCCSKWYAVRDAEAAAECEKLAAFWRDGDPFETAEHGKALP